MLRFQATLRSDTRRRVYLPLPGEPPLTRFVAAELSKDHWFNPAAAQQELGYTPRVTMAQGTAALIAGLRQSRESR